MLLLESSGPQRPVGEHTRVTSQFSAQATLKSTMDPIPGPQPGDAELIGQGVPGILLKKINKLRFSEQF